MMKKTLVFLLTALAAFVAKAIDVSEWIGFIPETTNPESVLDSIVAVNKAPYDDTSNHFTYDKEGNVVKITTNYTYKRGASEYSLHTLNRDLAYDSKGRLIQEILSVSYYKDPDVFVKQSKNEFSYNDIDCITCHTLYAWSDDKDDWEINHRDDFSFDKQGHMTSEASYHWYNGKCTGQKKQFWEYDDNGYLISCGRCSWSATDNDWYIAEKQEMTYFDGVMVDGEPGIRQLLVYYSFSSDQELTLYIKQETTMDFPFFTTIAYGLDREGQWEEQGKMDIEVNDDYKTVSRIIYNGDTPQSKVTLDYDSEGNLTQDCLYMWIAAISDWVLSSKIVSTKTSQTITSYQPQGSDYNNLVVYKLVEKTFDDEGRLLEELTSNEQPGGGLAPTKRLSYKYNSFGEQTFYCRYDWWTTRDEWIESEKRTTEYNNLGQILVDIEYSAKNLFELEPAYVKTYYYSDHSGSIDSLKSIVADKSFTVKGRTVHLSEAQEVTVYDLKGATVFSGFAASVNLPAAGMYVVVTASDGNGTIAVK